MPEIESGEEPENSVLSLLVIGEGRSVGSKFKAVLEETIEKFLILFRLCH